MVAQILTLVAKLSVLESRNGSASFLPNTSSFNVGIGFLVLRFFALGFLNIALVTSMDNICWQIMGNLQNLLILL